MAVDTSREAVERLASQFTDASLEARTIRTLLSERDAERAAKEKAEAERDHYRQVWLEA